ncbi:MAG: zf-HC2 domain-containing protein [Candidatus Zixiibacteriota bacterium]|nr:MAG: zf-HC2 domain-containing protein [candidate division Zixibacteria bacterium]
MKECNKQIEQICDYVDGELDSSLCRELEAHLKDCKNCRIMVDSLRQTVILCREGKPERLPGELESRLNSALKRRWKKKFGKK